MLARSVVVFTVSIACDVVDGLVVGTKSRTDSFASMAPAREGASSDSGCIAVAERGIRRVVPEVMPAIVTVTRARTPKLRMQRLRRQTGGKLNRKTFALQHCASLHTQRRPQHWLCQWLQPKVAGDRYHKRPKAGSNRNPQATAPSDAAGAGRAHLFQPESQWPAGRFLSETVTVAVH